jgi:hypothetical protein
LWAEICKGKSDGSNTNEKHEEKERAKFRNYNAPFKFNILWRNYWKQAKSIVTHIQIPATKALVSKLEREKQGV